MSITWKLLGFNIPSSGARDNDVDYHIGRFVLGLLCVGAISITKSECVSVAVVI